MINFKITTLLSKEIIVKRVSELLLENNRLAGSVSDDKFKIRKIPLWGIRNGFLPVFEGKIEKQSNGCIVCIKARLHYITSIVLAIWTIIFGSALFAIDSDNRMWLVAAMVAIVVMLVIGFIIPATRVINKLKALLK